MLKELAQTLLSQVLFVALFFAAVIGPFLLFRFDIAVYFCGAFVVAGILFIYWPRRKKLGDDEDA